MSEHTSLYACLHKCLCILLYTWVSSGNDIDVKAGPKSFATLANFDSVSGTKHSIKGNSAANPRALSLCQPLPPVSAPVSIPVSVPLSAPIFVLVSVPVSMPVFVHYVSCV